MRKEIDINIATGIGIFHRLSGIDILILIISLTGNRLLVFVPLSLKISKRKIGKGDDG